MTNKNIVSKNVQNRDIYVSKMLLKLFAIIFASSAPFLFSIKGDFVFDDSEAIIKNQAVTSDSWSEPFYTDFWGTDIRSNLSHKSYRPLTILSFRFNYLLRGKELSALDFKITNLLCHVLCCVVIWFMLKNIQKDNSKSKLDIEWLSTLLFAVHPIHVEAVCGVVGRADVLAALTFFLAFICYCKSLKNPRKHYTYLSATVALATMSMLFKENGITILGVCLFYEFIHKFKVTKYIKKKRKPSRDDTNRQLFLDVKSIIRIIVLSASVILLLYCRWIIMGSSVPKFESVDNPAAFSKNLFTKVATFGYIYLLNMILLVWPQWLCYDWSMGCVPLVESALDYRIILTTLVFLYGIIVVLRILNKKKWGLTMRLTMMSIGLMVIPFLPASNMFYPVGFVIAERILYIPSLGYCLLVVTGLNKIYRLKVLSKKMCYISFILLLSVFASRSYKRAFDWQNEYSLFVDGLSVCPGNAKVHYNVAKVAEIKQNTQWALDEYKEAIRLNPKYYQAMNNLANLLKNKKEYTEAENYLRTAIQLKQDFPAAWMNLGILLANSQRYKEAHEAYTTALKYRQKYPDCLYNLGHLYLDTHRIPNAMELWLKTVQLKPTHVLAWTNLLALADNTGQIDKALSLIPKALDLLPNVPSINFAIANIYGKMGRYELAEKYFAKTIKLAGPKVQAIHYANLGVLYHRWKKYTSAEEMYKLALKKDPNFRSAKKHLGALKLKAMKQANDGNNNEKKDILQKVLVKMMETHNKHIHING